MLLIKEINLENIKKKKRIIKIKSKNIIISQRLIHKETDWQIAPQLVFYMQIPLTKTEFELHSKHLSPLVGL